MGTRSVLNTTIFGQHLTATNHRTLSHTTSHLHTGYQWPHAVATLYQICVVLVVHSDTDTMVFGDKSHQRIHLYNNKKDALTHYDALIPENTGECDASSARKRHNNGGAENEKESDRSQRQRDEGTPAAVPSSMVGGPSSRDDDTLLPASALNSLAEVAKEILVTGRINPIVPPAGLYARRSGPSVLDKTVSATTRSSSSASEKAAVVQSGDRSQSQGGNGGHSHGPGGGSKATVVPESDRSQIRSENGGQAGGSGGGSKATGGPRSVMPGVKKGQTGGSRGVAPPKTSVTSSNPIPPQVGSSASRHKTCEHGTRRTRCPSCQGKSLCEHGKQKLHCRECRKDGAYANCKSFCEHGRQRSRCKD